MCKPILGFYIAGYGRSPEKRRLLLMMPHFKVLGFTSLQMYETPLSICICDSRFKIQRKYERKFSTMTKERLINLATSRVFHK